MLLSACLIVPGMAVTVESFVVTSNTSVFVKWSALAEIHYNDETVFYMITLTNTNTSGVEIMNTTNLTTNIGGTYIISYDSRRMPRIWGQA